MMDVQEDIMKNEKFMVLEPVVCMHTKTMLRNIMKKYARLRQNCSTSDKVLNNASSEKYSFDGRGFFSKHCTSPLPLLSLHSNLRIANRSFNLLSWKRHWVWELGVNPRINTRLSCRLTSPIRNLTWVKSERSHLLVLLTPRVSFWRKLVLRQSLIDIVDTMNVITN